MWIVTAETTKGKTIKYEIPAPRDTDRAFVLALAFQEHGAKGTDDPLTTNADVKWTSDNVKEMTSQIVLSERSNFSVERRVEEKGKAPYWDRHSTRAYRSIEAGNEALESAATENPGSVFRVVQTFTESIVVAVSKNSKTERDYHIPPKPKQEAIPGTPEPAEAAPAPEASDSSTKAA